MKYINRIITKEIMLHSSGLIFILLLILLTVGLEALSPWPFKILLDNVLGGARLDETTWLGATLSFFGTRQALGFFVMLAYCYLSLGITFSEYCSGLLTKRLNAAMIERFSEQAFKNLSTMAPGYYHQQEIGDYIYRLGYDVSALGSFLENGLIPLITHILYLGTTIVILLFVDRDLALVALMMLPLLFITMVVFNRQVALASERSEHSNSKLFSFIQEVLSQLKIIQAFNRQKDRAEAFSREEETALTDEVNVSSLNLLLNLLIGIIIAIGYAVVIVYGINAVFIQKLSVGLLIVFIFYLDNLTSPTLALMSAFASLKEDYVKILRLNDFFTKKFQTIDQGHLGSIKDSAIVFDHVSVKSSEGTVIFHDVSCTIPASKKTVVVGVSGSGKTTMANLLLRFLEPSSGRILIGGTTLSDYTLEGLRQAIAYVPQEVVLFNDTVKNNILFGAQATDREVKEAARLAIADHFISRLPGGFNFVVGEEGTNLSGGQRQRLMLARAFLKRSADVIIFDEPLSALDVKTRELLMESIDEWASRKTTIIISNVMEVITRADQVLVMNEGKLIHVGKGKNILDESRLTRLILESN